MEVNRLVSPPNMAGLEAKVGFSALDVKIDTAGDSIAEVSVLVEFGLAPLYIHPGRTQKNLSNGAPFLGPGVPKGNEADHENCQDYSDGHPASYRTNVFPLAAGPLLPWMLL
jgi:hypothetical protein